jgi:hypothetical protein
MTSMPTPYSAARRQKYTLHDSARALLRFVAPCTCVHRNVRLPNVRKPLHCDVMLGSMRPFSSAARAVKGLNVEPGGYAPETVLSSEGLSGSE